MSKWNKTGFPGVRFREHPTRRHGIRKDRYFSIYYRLGGPQIEEGLGWSSQGWTAEKANRERSRLKEAQRTGEGPQTLKEKRRGLRKKRQAEKEERARRALEARTFGEVFEHSYFPHAKDNKKRSSYRSEKSLFEKWIDPVIGKLPLKDIAPFHLEKIKKNMAGADKAPMTVRYALAVVRQVFNHARRNKLFDGRPPTAEVKFPSADNRRLRFLTRKEAGDLLEALAERSTDVRDMALLSLHCGLRAGEIFNLTWADVDPARGILTLRDTKSGRTRAAFMTESVKKMLADRGRGAKGDLVFISARGDRIRSVSKTFDRVVQEKGLNKGVLDSRQKVVFHTLRHTFASWLVEQGTDLYVVKKLLGHSTLALTERYSHLSEKALRTAVGRLEKVK